MTTNLVKLLDRLEKETLEISEMGAVRLWKKELSALLAVIRAQDKALNYIAKSAPGPEQLFELENKRMAERTQSEIEKLFGG